MWNEDMAEQAFIAYFGAVYLVLVSAVLLTALSKKRVLKLTGAAGVLLAVFLMVRYFENLDWMYRHGLLAWIAPLNSFLP
jgi:hypothetical protein